MKKRIIMYLDFFFISQFYWLIKSRSYTMYFTTKSLEVEAKLNTFWNRMEIVSVYQFGLASSYLG